MEKHYCPKCCNNWTSQDGVKSAQRLCSDCDQFESAKIEYSEHMYSLMALFQQGKDETTEAIEVQIKMSKSWNKCYGSGRTKS